ncbi:glutathione S-transferase omega-1-like protein [Dinothrombium tinctorium]|uniref:Glutathione S-transferase omega-1-like protein n=1 Tax=Dinothrombium tinctorium TaxID=1965070 RepID=A0A3S3Q2L0_9ACAR|nr:glutathione S-transferase omega-1-like protein [Dinothrombium tinctorium]RWS11789.1 glutathione S-transferase omega-1-like protein [Dinothrombium tinctorium]RWS12741.1 glutathione S-transferase omega-1-like protein [Dinothrombium tinctorium]
MALKLIENNYSQGSNEPSKPDADSLRIFGFQFCPYTERALLVLNAKQIKFDTVNINLRSKPEWFLLKNERGSVPVLELPDGRILRDSGLISDFVDEYFDGTRKVNPSDVYAKYEQKLFLENFASFFSNYNAIFRSKEDIKTVFDAVENALQILEKELERRKTVFIGQNDKPAMIDYMIWPWLERLPALISICRQTKDWENYLSQKLPLVTKYIKAMRDDSAVKKTSYSDDIHEEYLKFHIDEIRQTLK